MDEYKNLRDLTIDFSQDHLITVLIGRNGTGKSNVLEALTVIFRDLLMSERVPSLKYRIVYEIQDRWVFIDADPERRDVYRAKTISKKRIPFPILLARLSMISKENQSADRNSSVKTRCICRDFCSAIIRVKASG